MNKLPNEILEIIFNNLTVDEKIVISQLSKRFFDINFDHVNSFICSKAAENGHLDCLRYAHENGCAWDENTCAVAADGHLDCLRYAHENGCAWDKDTCENAAATGHLDCLRYAHENGCAWDENICFIAIEYGHLDCVKYVIANTRYYYDDINYKKELCKIAATNGHLECLKYIYEEIYEEDLGWYIYEVANQNGHIDCAQYIANQRRRFWNEDDWN